jgi:hypothetical protein
MASPAFVNSATKTSGSFTSLSLNMPSSIVAGNLLVAYAFDTNAGPPAMSGWTTIISINSSEFLYGFAKIAAGGDTGTLTSGSAAAGAVVVAQYSGWSGSISDIVVATNSSNSDPPLNNPAISEDWLWVAVGGAFITSTGAFTGAPTSYGDFVTASTGGGFATAVATADRALTASSENPGTFTSTGTLNFALSATVAIASVAAPVVAFPPQPWVVNQAAINRASLY